MELGPTFVHGREKSLLFSLVERLGISYTEREWPDYLWDKDKNVLMNADEIAKDTEIQQVFQWFADLPRETPPTVDISVLEWLRAKGATQRQIDVAHAVYANDDGCSINRMGLLEMIKVVKMWDYGMTYIIMQKTFSEIVNKLSQNLTIALNTPIHRVDYSTKVIKLYGPSGKLMRTCDRVIIAVPLTVLQNGDLFSFFPPLPKWKRGAIHRIQMENACKIFLSFDKQFWPSGMYDIVCPGSFIPEMWMTTKSIPENSNVGLSPHIVVGFWTGDQSVKVAEMSEKDRQKKALQQLDAIFGNSEIPKPASKSFIKSHFVDWSNEKYIGGCYSSPSLGAQPEDRDMLGKSIEDRIFFSGEHTHPGVNPTLQSCLEMAERCCRETLATFRDSKI